MRLKLALKSTILVLYCLISASQTEIESESSRRTARIVYGAPATKNQFPYFAFLVLLSSNNNDTNICGGTLINSKFVLTAAHCLTDVRTVWLSFGSNDRTSFPTSRLISNIAVHPKYDSAKKNNDIGIVKLQKPVGFATIALPTARYSSWNFEGLKMITVGFGRIENGFNPRYLYFTEQVGLSSNKCKSVYKNFNDLKLCAKGPNKSSICVGDSGGPLIHRNVLVGINSLVKTPSCINDTGGFTRVDRYLDWINGKMATL